MVYIRNKQVKGKNYAYLVRSVWDKDKKSTSQQTIKYLGRSSKVTIDDIPVRFRNNPNVIKFLVRKKHIQHEDLSELIYATQKEILIKLSESVTVDYTRLYEQYKENFSTIEFFDKVIKPILYDVGDRWKQNKLLIGTEHVISNRINTVIKQTITHRKKRTNYKILICNPAGERHNIACNILESVLINNGFNVFNISPSTPSEDVLQYIDEIKPNLILISITLPNNIKAGINLVERTSNSCKIPIIVGGQAINSKNSNKFLSATVMDSNNSFNQIVKKITMIQKR
jgi:methanogenic corrinoid protein MtbC1